jgi:hypothetical protein
MVNFAQDKHTKHIHVILNRLEIGTIIPGEGFLLDSEKLKERGLNVKMSCSDLTMIAGKTEELQNRAI